MAFFDRVMETTTTTGTGDITTAGAVTANRTLNNSAGTNVLFDYVIEAIDASGIPTGDWELGKGYMSASTTLVRYVVKLSSNSNALVNLSAGTKRVYITLPSYEIQSNGHIVARVAALTGN
jgi:hypothetical protein